MANPLGHDEPITFSGSSNAGGRTSADAQGDGWWRCTSPHVRLVRVGEMAGNVEGVFAVEYRPLIPTDDEKPEEAELAFEIEELGTYR